MLVTIAIVTYYLFTTRNKLTNSLSGGFGGGFGETLWVKRFGFLLKLHQAYFLHFRKMLSEIGRSGKCRAQNLEQLARMDK